MHNLLSLETATAVCSVAIQRNDGQIFEQNINDGNRHSKIITLLIRDLLTEAGLSMSDLDAVAVSKGPGSYTGLRVGYSAAKAICFAMDIPLLCIDSLEALAYANKKKGYAVAPMIDARRMEVYYSLWNDKHEQLRETNALVVDEHSFDDLLESGAKLILCGDGAQKIFDIMESTQFLLGTPISLAKYLLPIAQEAYLKEQFADVAYAVPFYFKSPLITKSKKKLFGN